MIISRSHCVRSVLLLLFAWMLVGCSSSPTEPLSEKKPSPGDVQTPEEWALSQPNVKEAEFRLEKDDQSVELSRLDLVMDPTFQGKPISRQYDILVDLYERFNEQFSLGDLGFLSTLDVYYKDSEKGHMVFTIFNRTASIHGVALEIDRETGDRLSEESKTLLDDLDRNDVAEGYDEIKADLMVDSLITVEGDVEGYFATEETSSSLPLDPEYSMDTGAAWNTLSIAMKRQWVGAYLRKN